MPDLRFKSQEDVGERELACTIRAHGFACERTGRNGITSEDVTHDIPGVHLEAPERRAVPTTETITMRKGLVGFALVVAVVVLLDGSDAGRGVRCYLAGEGSLRDLWDYVRGYEV